jgi:monoamine oxidase
MEYDIIIVGAGAAGLMAAKELGSKGLKVLILEAQERTGGKIKTVADEKFPFPIEEGPEFIHGDLPVTMGLLKEAGIPYISSDEKMLRIEDGKWREEDSFIEGWDEVIQRMKELKDDISLVEFMERYFKDDRYKKLRESIQRFAEGFDLVDINIASTIALREEWQHENEEQYRIPHGYYLLTDYLVSGCKKKGTTIITGAGVKTVNWKKDNVIVRTEQGQEYRAAKLIVTASPGLLTLEADKKAFIDFSPSIDRYREAAKCIGYGSVIKVFMLFENFFSDVLKEPSFILSDQAIPTWWTKLSGNEVFLTGWLGGPKAAIGPDHEEEIFQTAMNSLCAIFKVDCSVLQSKMKAFRYVNWNNNQYSAGAYSYNLIESVAARKLLRTGIHQTVFFAGEALYEGASPGTVEAALQSGKDVARNVYASLGVKNQ